MISLDLLRSNSRHFILMTNRPSNTRHSATAASYGEPNTLHRLRVMHGSSTLVALLLAALPGVVVAGAVCCVAQNRGVPGSTIKQWNSILKNPAPQLDPGAEPFRATEAVMVAGRDSRKTGQERAVAVNAVINDDFRPAPRILNVEAAAPRAPRDGPAGFSVSPVSISNYFDDFVTLTLTNIPAGAEVRFDRYQVTGPAAAIDGNAQLIQSFVVKDGVNGAIGGLSNPNVPGDENPVSGAITARISFADVFVGNTIGSQVIRASSPTGAFTAVTGRLAVTAEPEDQQFQGTVRTAGGTPVPHAFVALLDPEQLAGGGFEAATLADANGDYSLPAPAGEYFVIAARPGFTTHLENRHYLTDSVDEDVDITMTPGTRTLSGRIRNERFPQLNYPGVLITMVSSTGEFAATVTDSSGNWSAAVTPASRWECLLLPDFLMHLGLLAGGVLPVGDTSEGNSPGLDFPLYPVQSLVSGHVTTDSVPPVPLEGVYVQLGAGTSAASAAYTDENGYYVLGVPEGRNTVQIYPESAEEFERPGGLEQRFFIAAGTAQTRNFILPASNATLAGAVKDDAGATHEDFTISFSSTASAPASTFDTTESDGTFSKRVPAGSWKLSPVIDSLADSGLIWKEDAPVVVGAAAVIDNLTLRLFRPTREINLTLSANNGQLPGGVEVRITSVIGGATYRAAGYTDEDGVVVLPALPGTWSVTVSANMLAALGYRSTPVVSVTVGAATSVPLTIPLTAFTREAPKLEVQQAANQKTVRVTGERGRSYLLEQSDDMRQWSAVDSVDCPDGTGSSEPVGAGAAKRYFRLRY